MAGVIYHLADEKQCDVGVVACDYADQMESCVGYFCCEQNMLRITILMEADSTVEIASGIQIHILLRYLVCAFLLVLLLGCYLSTLPSTRI